MAVNTCPCGGDDYATCCGPLHAGVKDAATAVELMRSRYSAYAVSALDYVFRTWHPRTRPETIEPSGLRWTGLRIVEVEGGGASDQFGIVEFVAAFADRGRRGELGERSSFERRRGRWVYVEAV